jgi:hypothetical protein
MKRAEIWFVRIQDYLDGTPAGEWYEGLYLIADTYITTSMPYWGRSTFDRKSGWNEDKSVRINPDDIATLNDMVEKSEIPTDNEELWPQFEDGDYSKEYMEETSEPTTTASP